MALKSKALKKSLTQTAEENTNVTIGTSKEQTTLKEGTPRDMHTIQKPLCKTVGISIGSTINMGEYQSLRADVWLTDEVQYNETFDQAYERVTKVVTDTLEKVVSIYTES